jgi:hypothetical protein
MSFGRDIITQRDAIALRTAWAASVKRAAASVPGGIAPDDRQLGGELPAMPPSKDSWYRKLMKFIPGEAMGVYLGLDRAVQTVDSGKALWLALVLVLAILFNIAYLKRIWQVERNSQVAVSSLVLVAYVYATGGVFLELGIAVPEAQMVVLIATGAFLVFFEPPALATPDQSSE